MRFLNHTICLEEPVCLTRSYPGNCLLSNTIMHPYLPFTQAMMTTVTALFMIPTAVIFPTLLREANCPPSSVTLRRKPPARAEPARHWGEGHGRSMDHLYLDDDFDDEDADFDEALLAGEIRPLHATIGIPQ